MNIINWTPEYSVGVEELDKQHQKLATMINDLFNLYAENKFNHVDVAPIFKKLEEYGLEHFATEEHYFEIFNYPKKEEHIALHKAYNKEMDRLKMSYDAENSAATLFALNNFLNDWWIWHINHIDKEYTSYFHANGLK